MKNELIAAAVDGAVGAYKLYIALFVALVTGPFRVIARVGSEWLADRPMHVTRTKTINPH